MIAGLEDITHGTLEINGKVVNNLAPKARGIAMVFQSYALYPTLNVYENMAFSLDLAGFDDDVIDKRVKETAKILGLTDYLDRKPRALSGGQRQRVALGRAIIRKANIFLMDEPLSNLDARQRVSMRSELIRIHRSVGATTIYVTHDQTEALTLADRIVVMSMGRVQQIGKPYEIYNDPENVFVASFIGNPPMNFFPGTIEKGIFKGQGFEIPLSEANRALTSGYDGSGKKIILAIRPENFEVGKGLPFQVELVEHLGQSSLVHGLFEGNKAVLKLAGWQRLNPGDIIEVALRQEKICFFDGEDEKRVRLEKSMQNPAGKEGK
jgi:multiple sugar transport system ATP-binding protein